MNTHRYLANAVLWASAIVAAAALGASPFVSIMLLPMLATVSLLVTLPARRCGSSQGSHQGG